MVNLLRYLITTDALGNRIFYFFFLILFNMALSYSLQVLASPVFNLKKITVLDKFEIIIIKIIINLKFFELLLSNIFVISFKKKSNNG